METKMSPFCLNFCHWLCHMLLMLSFWPKVVIWQLPMLHFLHSFQWYSFIYIYMTPFSIHGDTQKVLHTADYTLTHCGLVMPYGDTDLDQHWFRWWLITWQHQAITNVDLSPVKSSDIHLRAINSWDILQASITKSCFKLTNLKFPSNLLKANKLINWSPKESARQTMECLNSNF